MLGIFKKGMKIRKDKWWNIAHVDPASTAVEHLKVCSERNVLILKRKTIIS